MIEPLPMLRVIRKEMGKTQDWLAEQVGMTKASISRIEKGDQNWDAAFLRAAARALSVDSADLLKRRTPQETAVMLAMRGLGPKGQQAAVDMVRALERSGTDS
jgi:transcriptional regulator with XRE-family HTH domain